MLRGLFLRPTLRPYLHPMLQRFRLHPFRYNEAMSAALGLFRLQQVDTRISQMEARLRKIQETLDNDSELQAAMQKRSGQTSPHRPPSGFALMISAAARLISEG